MLLSSLNLALSVGQKLSLPCISRPRSKFVQAQTTDGCATISAAENLELRVSFAQVRQWVPVRHLELDQQFPRDHVSILLIVR